MTYRGTCTAKTGEPIPLFADGKPMHSKYSPAAESEQFARGFDDETGCVVVAGIGGAFHLRALLERPKPFVLIALESDDDALAFCMALPLVQELTRHGMLVGTADTVEQLITGHYLPAVHGKIAFASQRAWEDHNAVQYSNIKSGFERALARVSADYSVQAHFALQWQRNIFLNLREFCGNADVRGQFDTKKTAAVIAAGPGLDRDMAELTQNRGRYCVFATDTAYSALSKKGIWCDAVVSIDAQQVSLMHFMPLLDGGANSAQGTVFFFDAASNPSAVRLSRKHGGTAVLVHNGHPLSAQAGLWRIDAGSGTVTIAACDVAAKLGFGRIRLFGADFAYDKKPYARGTYLDELYNTAANRLNPAQQQFCALMFRTELLEDGGKTTTPVLLSYRTALGQWAARNAFSADRHGGNGTMLVRHGETPPTFSAPQGFSFAQFREEWREQTQALVERYDGQNEIPLSLVPLVAFLRTKEVKKKSIFWLLKLAYSYCLRYTE